MFTLSEMLTTMVLLSISQSRATGGTKPGIGRSEVGH